MRTVNAAFLLFPALVWAQGGRSELFGTITDPGQLPISKAQVTAEETSTGRVVSTLSGDPGNFHILGLPSGSYTLSVEHPGFRRYSRDGIVLRLGSQTRVDIQLEIDAPSETVQVRTSSPTVSFNAGERTVEQLPMDGRNFISLTTLSPGVALPGGGSLLPRINGSRPRTNEYIYDGISVLQPEPGQVVFYPVVDAVEEFQLNINSYSPEYGRSNGGVVIVSGKSGSNTFHGSIFEFFRNEALNARNYFAQPGPNPEFRRNQYGFVLGGPIRQNHTFFFADWQGTRLRTGITRFSTVPTAVQRPAGSSDFLALYPLPNRAGAANNYVRTGVEPDNQDQFDVRLDHVFNAAHHAFVRYGYLRDDDTPVTPLPDGSGTITSGVTGHALTRGDSAASEWEWTVSPNILNQFRAGYTRRTFNQTAPQNGPIYTIAGFQQIGSSNGANSDQVTNVTEFVDTLSAVRGRHTWKAGFDFRREALDVFGPPNPTGTFAFTSLTAAAAGQVNTYSKDTQGEALNERAHIAEFFINDEWRMSDRLQLSLGTRYTLNLPSTEKNGHGSVFNLQTQKLDFVRTGRNLEGGNFGPRVGLAYRMGDNWTIRSGYGMVWFEQSGVTTPFTLPQFPFVQTLTQQSPDGVTPAFLLSQGPSAQPRATNDPDAGLGQGVFGTQRNNGSGYSQQWNLTTERSFGSDWNVQAGYLGSKNTRLGLPEANLNQLPTQYLSMGASLLLKVPNPFYGVVPAGSSLGQPTIAQQLLLRAYPRFTTVALFRNNVGQSSYNAAFAKLEKRFSHGLTLSGAYTFSKLMDDASSYFSQTIFTGPVLNNSGAADAFNRHLERDVSAGDIPRVFSLGWSYEVPSLWRIRGWRIAGLVRVQSGDAVPVSQSVNNNAAFGYAVQRPNRIGNPNEYATRSASRWFDTTMFTNAPQFTIGTSSRNPVRGPGLQNADLMIGKTFRVTEGIGAEFRAEAFNVSNTPPLNDPNGTFGSSSFGTITSAGNPRDFEFALKIRF